MANFCVHSGKTLESLVLKDQVAGVHTWATWLDCTGAFPVTFFNKPVSEMKVNTILSRTLNKQTNKQTTNHQGF